MTPVLGLLLVFLIIPIVLALYVSFTNWNGQGGPFSASAQRIGLQNYKDLLLEPGLTRKNFVTSVRNNLYFVLVVVPVQTALALFLALIVNQRRLRGKGFFRTAFYMPSVSSSIAISLIFVFLFAQQGAVNRILAWFGLGGRQWFNNGEGTIHAFLALFGVDSAPGLPRRPPAARPVVVGVAERAVVVDARDHHARHLDDLRHVHADVPRRAADGARRGPRGGGDRRGVTMAGVPPGHSPAAAPPRGARRHARADRHVAGVRPDLRDERRRPGTPPPRRTSAIPPASATAASDGRRPSPSCCSSSSSSSRSCSGSPPARRTVTWYDHRVRRTPPSEERPRPTVRQLRDPGPLRDHLHRSLPDHGRHLVQDRRRTPSPSRCA